MEQLYDFQHMARTLQTERELTQSEPWKYYRPTLIQIYNDKNIV